MKTITILIISTVLLTSNSCENKGVSPTKSTCVDSTLINPNGVCTMEYDPVCGCNGVTYSNPCTAETQGGVKTYIKGECPK